MTDLVSFFTIDYSTAIQIAKPITFEQGRAFYLNPIAIAQGDVDAPVKVAIAKSPDGIAPEQTAIATDEMDTSMVLRPDGAGGVHWTQGAPYSYRYAMTLITAGMGGVTRFLGYSNSGTSYQNSGITYSGAGIFTIVIAGTYAVCATWEASGTDDHTKHINVNGSDVPDNGEINGRALFIYLEAGDAIGLRFSHLGSGITYTGSINIARMG